MFAILLETCGSIDGTILDTLTIRMNHSRMACSNQSILELQHS